MPRRGGSRGTPYARSGVYTASGAPVRNAAAYAATGAPTYTASGKAISNAAAYSGAIEASVRQNTSTPKYLYHYTDTESLGSISSSGVLKQSTGPGDCALGEGVYLTAKPPRSSSASLLDNNYDCAASSVQPSKVDAYVRVDADRVGARSGRDALGRDVFVVPGDLHLASAGASIGRR